MSKTQVAYKLFHNSVMLQMAAAEVWLVQENAPFECLDKEGRGVWKRLCYLKSFEPFMALIMIIVYIIHFGLVWVRLQRLNIILFYSARFFFFFLEK